eukprot:CAMPEP_0170525870 /NCGR_PEP_ID=MMETSP0209-20121228/11310_1 /TAXON_ID=665100 ORGANISM="Litonotus pictus, Strain P1" /NCGR_SAMPLE_ID=MMETSP0209 /ASSEMBLY_ACC=CAM_ASM_000301 /LENGTH=54 /DNA_ID=CAMNT_0010815365 /DNA_START=520 /DNA_END=684 /DNA_ORIENTATION=+
MSVTVSDTDDTFHSGSLSGLSLLLDRLNLEALFLQGLVLNLEKLVNYLRFLNGD